MQITIGDLGAVIGTQLYRTETAPRYLLGHSFALGYMCASVVVVSTIWFVLSRQDRRRDATGIEGKVGDYGDDWKGDEDVRWRYSI